AKPVVDSLKSLPIVVLALMGLPKQEEQFREALYGQGGVAATMIGNAEILTRVAGNSELLRDALLSTPPEEAEGILGEATMETFFIVAPLSKAKALPGETPTLKAPPRVAGGRSLPFEEFIGVPERNAVSGVEGIRTPALAPLRDRPFVKAEQAAQTVQKAAKAIPQTVHEVDLPRRIRAASGSGLKEVGEFFGWKTGYVTKGPADFTKESLLAKGWTKERLLDVAEGYEHIQR